MDLASVTESRLLLARALEIHTATVYMNVRGRQPTALEGRRVWSATMLIMVLELGALQPWLRDEDLKNILKQWGGLLWGPLGPEQALGGAAKTIADMQKLGWQVERPWSCSMRSRRRRPS